MRALQVQALTGPDGVRPAQVPEPEADHPLTPGSGVLIEVHAAGVTFADVLVARGAYQQRLDPPYVPGMEVAGVVRGAPADAGVRAGERVAGFTFAGAMAELAVAPAFMTFPLHHSLSFAEGAGLILNYHTAWFALVRRGRLREGETVLVHGAAGGVGTAALQVASALGARTLAVVSSDEKARVAREAGAQEVLSADGPWREQARALTGGAGVDLVLDPVGGERFTHSLRSLHAEGRVVVVGFTGGTVPQVKVNRLLLHNTEVVGAAWREYAGARPQLAREIGAQVGRLVERGLVRPVVGARFPLERGADAFRLIEGRGARGKVVLDVPLEPPAPR